MKRKLAVLMSLVMVFACFAFTACSGGTEEAEEPEVTEETAVEETEEAQEPVVDGSEYGYIGTDPVECAVYEYMADEISENYDVGDDEISVPAINIIATEEAEDGGTDVWGDFRVYNYEIDGETLVCTSGGSHPGKMHVVKDEDEYEVASFDAVADGADYDPSAKEIFGDKYDAFVKASSDEEAAAEIRTKILSDYVKANGLAVTQYQDYGWDPVPLDL